jgi:serpin B
MAMTLCYAGSRGSTHDSLKNVLCFGSSDDTELFKHTENFHAALNNANKGSYALEMANKLYPKNDYPLNKEYTDLVKKYFDADLNPLDFNKKTESANAINKWVSQVTRNKINNLISPDVIDELTRIILVNAIYFKGLWTTQFEKEKTMKYDFNVSKVTKKQVDMMILYTKDFKCFDTDFGAAVCELPYRGGDISMTIILPNEDNSLENVEKSLTTEKLKEILNREEGTRKVNIFLPKFKLQYGSDVNIILLLYDSIESI